MKELDRIVSKHLGKAGDGSIVKPYVTPDRADKSLLVPVPRVLNRTLMMMICLLLGMTHGIVMKYHSF